MYDYYIRKSKISTWLYKVALNTAMTYNRKNKKNTLENIEKEEENPSADEDGDHA